MSYFFTLQLQYLGNIGIYYFIVGGKIMGLFDKLKGNPKKQELMKENQVKYFNNEKALIKFQYDMIKYCLDYFEKNILSSSEEVLAGTPASYESNDKDHKGMLIATSERLYFVTSNLGFGQYSEATDYPEITGFKIKAKLSKEITVETRHHTKVFKDVMPGIGDNVVNVVQTRVRDFKTSSPTATGTTLSAADEIKKYKNLLDEGILTQEEFDAKKKELLGL